MQSGAPLTSVDIAASISVLASRKEIVSELAQFLSGRGLTINENARLKLLIDIPIGWALQNSKSFSTSCHIVATENTCPEYLSDVMKTSPLALTRIFPFEELYETCKRRDQQSRCFPFRRSTLSLSESEIVSMIALGMTCKQIAAKRGVGYGTVRNILGRAYLKLNIRSSAEVVMYYYGLAVRQDTFKG